jgi:RNA polymerase sigma-70 factor (ECF subfamily)
MKNTTTLLRQARGGDQRALAEAYDEYAPAIYRYAYRLTGHESTAQDVTSETFHKLLASLRNGGGPTDNLSAWLYRVAHNLVVDGYRSQPDDPPVPLDQAPEIPVAGRQEARLEQQERVDRARSALQRLTALQQQVIGLRFLEGLSIKETAAAMEKTEGAVKALQYRATNSLRRILEERDDQT